jgi:hypothetical protein
LLGEIENARAAFAVFNGIENAGAVDLAEAIVAFPYTDAAVLTRLAQGLEKAGAKVWYTREDGGYLPLIGQNRLRGSEIKEVLAGGIIEGKRFRYASQWRRKGRAEGEVIYSGWPIHPGVGSGNLLIAIGGRRERFSIASVERQHVDIVVEPVDIGRNHNGIATTVFVPEGLFQHDQLWPHDHADYPDAGQQQDCRAHHRAECTQQLIHLPFPQREESLRLA